MTDLLYLHQFERTMDEWHNGQITLEDAHDALVRIGHDPEEAQEILRAHDPKRFDRQHQHYSAELAGVI
jgi:hypothetical protein